ncbi:hypothetical protein BASA81_003573 [Batrachochytrium salamandrivorans]|nr:hypothetical protein BASA81_003573 [Batrachochytrium salamandrivorans]
MMMMTRKQGLGGLVLRRGVFSNSKARKVGVVEAFGVEGVALGWVFIATLGFAFQWSLKDQEKAHKLQVFSELKKSF